MMSVFTSTTYQTTPNFQNTSENFHDMCTFVRIKEGVLISWVVMFVVADVLHVASVLIIVISLKVVNCIKTI